MKHKSYSQAASAVLMALLIGMAPDSGMSQQLVLEEIVVTARKRNESLLDVPLAVTAFSAQDLLNIGAKDLEDIAEFSPGLYFSSMGNTIAGRSSTVIRFRGMDTNTTASQRQLASLFVDGVYVASGAQGLGLDDIERVEVIKGPQSAFFGRSTFSGAINYVTKTPAEEWSGRISAEAGRFGHLDNSLSVEGPIVSDKLSLRVTGRLYQQSGQYINNANPAERLGKEQTYSIAGTVYMTPNQNFSAKARVLYYEDKDGAPLQGTFLSTTHNCMPGINTYFCGTLPNPTQDQIGIDSFVDAPTRAALIDGINPNTGQPWASWQDSIIDGFGLERHALRTSLQMEYTFPGSGITISSITAYNEVDQNTLGDADRSPSTTIFWQNWGENLQEDWSQEIRISSAQDDRFRWTIGGNYFDHTRKGSSRVYWSIFGYLQFTDNFPSRGDVETSAVFGSAAYDISEQLTINLEARYQEDKVSQTAFMQNPIADTFKNFLPRVILDYAPNEDTTLYATFARGNRPGTFNAGLVGQPADVLAEVERQTGSGISVDEEELDNYELGYKARLLDGQAQVAVAAYYMEWKNQQTRGQAVLPPLNPGEANRFYNTTTAIGRTDLKGIELEGNLQATGNLLLAGTFNVADSKFKIFNCNFCARVTGTEDVRGNQSPRIPKYSATASATWSDELAGDWGWYTRADYIFTSKTYTEAFNLANTGAFHRVNLRLGVEKDNLRVEGYVRNLFDERRITAAARTTDLFDFSKFMLAITLPEKRTFGIKASYNF